MSAATAAPEPHPTRRMDIAIMGPMRSGSTLLSDLLTIRGECLILSEPNIMGRWSPTVVERMHRLAVNFGLDPGPAPPQEKDWPSYRAYFDEVMLPQLERLPRWGAKYVDIVDWRPTIERYRPKRLILTVRDIRDVTISSIDRIARLKLAFYGRRFLRDEAWVLSHLVFTVHELMALREIPHLLLRYEDMASNPTMRQKVADYVGCKQLSERRENLEAGGMARQWELAKHGEGVSTKSIGRYREEPAGPVKALAERVWRLVPEYSETFGYEVPPPESWIRGHDFSTRGPGERNPINYRRAETPDWTGPRQFEPSFALRAARRFIASRLPKTAVVAELGCGAPAIATLLPAGVRYVAVDVAIRAKGYRTARLDQLRFPVLPGVTHLLIFGWLERLTPDLPKLLRILRHYDRPVIATYHTTDGGDAIDRLEHGWVNHLDRKALAAACRKAGFKLGASWARDSRQSFLHLRPLPRKPKTATRPA